MKKEIIFIFSFNVGASVYSKYQIERVKIKEDWNAELYSIVLEMI